MDTETEDYFHIIINPKNDENDCSIVNPNICQVDLVTECQEITAENECTSNHSEEMFRAECLKETECDMIEPGQVSLPTSTDNKEVLARCDKIDANIASIRTQLTKLTTLVESLTKTVRQLCPDSNEDELGEVEQAMPLSSIAELSDFEHRLGQRPFRTLVERYLTSMKAGSTLSKVVRCLVVRCLVMKYYFITIGTAGRKSGHSAA